MNSKDQIGNSTDESQIQALFAKAKRVELEPSPYMKTRILANLREMQAQKRKTYFWKWLSVGSLAAMMFMGWISLNLYNQASKDGVVHESYVIQVDFNSSDLEKVAKAEVVLPEDVHFVSSQKQIQAERRLKLPITLKSAGRGKLPFVVASNATGEKKITVRLLDENENVVREQVLKFKFAKDEHSFAL